MSNPVCDGLAVVAQGALLEASPMDVQRALQAAMKAAAMPITEKPEVMRGLVAAEAIPVGLVISGEAAALALVDALHEIVAAQKALGADTRALVSIARGMELAVRDTVRNVSDRLETARVRGGEARVAYQVELRRQAAAEEQRRQEEARKLEQAAQQEAIASGGDIPPPAEMARIEVPRTVTAGSGASGTMVRVKACEIVDDAACPANWKALVAVIAEGFFRTAERCGQVTRAAPGGSVVWQGVRFESIEGAVNR